MYVEKTFALQIIVKLKSIISRSIQALKGVGHLKRPNLKTFGCKFVFKKGTATRM